MANVQKLLILFVSIFVINIHDGKAQTDSVKMFKYPTPEEFRATILYSRSNSTDKFLCPKKYLPVICRWETTMNKSNPLPVYFRLGSKQYVDFLEQKTNSPILQ